jgi:anti-sigma B factor antagonist
MDHARSLSVGNRRLGDVIVVTCVGRVVAGDDAAALEQHVMSLLPDNSLIVLNWHDVNYIDSGGLGLVVRLLNRTRTARGDLKLCAVSERVREVLKITRLDKVFDLRETEADAIAAFRRPFVPVDTPIRLDLDILCVQESADVGAYVGEVLRQAGYRVITLNNLPDALMLFKGSRPKLVLISAALRAATGTGPLRHSRFRQPRCPSSSCRPTSPGAMPGRRARPFSIRFERCWGVAVRRTDGEAPQPRDVNFQGREGARPLAE